MIRLGFEPTIAGMLGKVALHYTTLAVVFVNFL